ncbi:MAG: transcriptional regulator [Caldilineaceae bacterium SB0665_bin_21]|nr:transcriptional regulator [Caldilineaceae bacterium SB0665_bin_21]MYA04507.1 transcriptional regulator [Caldilineaceae bacterium SB0664_bin_22]MYC64130.1 transcriptional regulator [Caldilineaceae bacterium SB0661_bin_34]
MKFNDFLARHAVFTVKELDCFLSARGTGNPSTRKSLLVHHRKQGRIIRVRRGLYAAVPWGMDPASMAVDPFLVAAKMTEDAVLAYHTALEFHGKAYSVHWRLVYVSARKSQPLAFQSHSYRGISVPSPLRTKGERMFGVECQTRSGVELRVTSHERTLVDMLDRPDLTGSWEEIWRSLEAVEFFDLDQVVEYTRVLGNATTAAKVGFFLEQHRESLMVQEMHLNELRKLCPKQPHYLERGRGNHCKWVKGWNLMIPAEILGRTWGETL